jgi:hypothetical protein
MIGLWAWVFGLLYLELCSWFLYFVSDTHAIEHKVQSTKFKVQRPKPNIFNDSQSRNSTTTGKCEIALDGPEPREVARSLLFEVWGNPD